MTSLKNSKSFEQIFMSVALEDRPLVKSIFEKMTSSARIRLINLAQINGSFMQKLVSFYKQEIKKYDSRDKHALDKLANAQLQFIEQFI